MKIYVFIFKAFLNLYFLKFYFKIFVSYKTGQINKIGKSLQLWKLWISI